jgi:hypothetical protein
MNEQIQQALMTHVERAVRPLRAGRKRKLQMREELLAHLSSIYREQLDRGHGEAAALAAARQRFGEAAELSAELAASLTWHDRFEWRNEACILALDRTVTWRTGETFGRFALRTAAWLAGINFVFCLSMIAVAWLGGSQRFDPTFAMFNRYTAVLFSTMAIGQCAIVWAIQTTRRTAFSPGGRFRRLAAAGQLSLWTLVFLLVAAGFWLGVTPSLSAVLAHLPRIALCTAATVPAFLLLVAWMVQLESIHFEPHRRWQQLQLDQ